MKKLAAAMCFLAGSVLGPVSAQAAMTEDECMELTLAMADLELSMVGKAKVEPEQARTNLDAMRTELPDDLDPHITALLDISRRADETAPDDPQHPMATGVFQEANAAYRQTLAPHCPSFNLDY